MEILRGIVGLWNLALMLGSIAVLLWFVYHIFVRKLLRAKRIANIRLNRIMRERQDSL